MAIIALMIVLTGCSLFFNKPPVAVIRAHPTVSSYAPLAVTFDASGSYDPDGSIIRYEWSFGDGTHDVGPVVTHVYTTKGHFQASVKVIDDKGSIGEATITIAVGSLPEFTETSFVMNFPAGSVVNPGQFLFLSPAGSAPVGPDGRCTLSLLTGFDQLVIVTNPSGDVIMMRYVFAGESSPQSLGSLEVTPKSTALALVGLSPAFLVLTWEEKKEAFSRVESHPLFNRLIEVLEHSIKLGVSIPRESYPLAARISEEVVRAYAPTESPRYFSWYWPRKDYDGPHLAAQHATASNIYMLNPKSIYYGVDVFDFDTHKLLSADVLPPAEWFFLIYLRPGILEFFLGNQRLTIRCSKGLVSEGLSVGSINALFLNGLLAGVYILNAIASINIPSFHRLKEIAPTAELTVLFNDLCGLLKEQPSAQDVILFFLNALSNDNVLRAFFRILVKYGLSNINMQAIELALKTIPIIKLITAVMSVWDMARFFVDLAGAIGERTYSIQLANRLTCIPKVSLLSHTTEALVGDELSFVAEASDEDGTIVKYVWDFGDGHRKETTINRVNYRFASAGTFAVRVRVEDDAGSWCEAKREIRIKERPNQPPVAKLQAQPIAGSVPLTVNFDASPSYDPDGHIVSYQWRFGDGSTKNTTDPLTQYTYGREGIFIASVTVVDNQGATATAQVTITVTAPACPDLTPLELWVEPTQFVVGQRIKVWAKIKNIGNGNSGAFRVALLLDGRELDSGTLNGLAAGQEVTVYSDVLVWPDNNCHTLAMTVDLNNAVSECNEGNNHISKSFCPSQQCINRPNISTDRTEYCLGDEVAVFVSVSVPSYVDVWIVYPDGRTKDLLTNKYLEDPRKQYVIKAKAGQPTGSRTLYLKAKACNTEVTVRYSFTVKSCDSPPDVPSKLPD
ncbi:MAG: PKD domain-containing protein, partial [Candidatus Bipolaricaulaceae bacterium]